ncbi:hypothetical protein B0H14DRAFT_3487098 [Mycena olivaceomarginata]|nr:hypothetical protein B0H14DRAFT_3487098 [Mycena olivaceomarginata]
MVGTTLEDTFKNLSLSTPKSFFYPRKGFEDKQGSETFEFYVVTKGHAPGIYTHWEDASVQVTGFKKSVHKKYTGWSAATQAWDATHQPVATPHTPPPLDRNRMMATPPRHPQNASCRSVKRFPTSHSQSPQTHLSGSALGNLRKRGNVFSLQSFGHTLRDGSPAQARAGNLSADGRRADVQYVQLQDEHESGLGAESSASFADQDNGDEWQDLPMENVIPTQLLSSRKRKRYAATDSNLRHWVENFRDAYLRVLVTREGPMGQEGLCSCGETARYRCSECHGVQMLCKGCMVEAHWLRPLCRIEAWTGSFFERRELRQLGLRVQLGHPDNTPCPRANRGHEKFVVISPNGFHHVAVDFCQCRLSGSQHRWEQLLSYGWFPSTPDAPKSAITVPTLKLFHAVSLQGKTTRRYQLALCVVREWRSLRALKRGGMGNDPDRCAAETRSGELAVDCIACPKAGVNLPDGWEKAPPEKRFLYAIYWAIDACFRLKRKMISSWAADPSIQDGWAYFTAWKDYGPFVKTLGEQKEMSTCTGLAALDHANTKYSQGYAATGCGMVTCGRHEVVAKNGVGDLQAGEKYGNMDYIVASAWQHVHNLLFFLLSYDIMCQWSKNLKERLLNLPPALRFHLVQYFVKFVIPKLHILSHLKKCQDFFSLLYTLGAAQADMEGIERIWSSSGLMGVSTREMGPGSRQDTLDDFWHFWNWNKVVGMGQTLRKRFAKATKELARQQEGLEEFIEGQHDKVDTWKKAVDDFESGASLANPYKLPQSGPSLRDIELELICEEQERERSSAAAAEAGEDTMTGFLMLGLEIEGQQRELAADLLANRSPTTKNLTDFVTRRTRIARQVKKLRLMQRKYSPGALQRLATAGDGMEAAEAERIPLLLPSALSAADSLLPLSVPELAAAEARLRDTQCAGSLDLIRHGLGVKRRLQTYKTLHSHRQHQTTRSRSLVDSQHRKIEVAAATYRQVRLARLALAHVAGGASWRPLEKADLRLLEDEEEAKKRKQRAMKGKRKEAAQVNEQGEGAGYTGGVVGKDLQDGVRIEWCKAYARVKRWREELLLLQEEMNRCLRTLEWQAEVHLQGAMALAARQAAMRRKLASRLEIVDESKRATPVFIFPRIISTTSSRIPGGIVFSEMPSFGLVPCEHHFVVQDDLVNELLFFWKQESVFVYLHFARPVQGVSFSPLGGSPGLGFNLGMSSKGSDGK